jgi:hypothetical protein
LRLHGRRQAGRRDGVLVRDVKQAGGMGFWSADPQTSGQFRTSGGLLSTDGGTRYWYCSSGNTLTFSPLSEGPSTTGSIVLQQ